MLYLFYIYSPSINIFIPNVIANINISIGSIYYLYLFILTLQLQKPP